MVSALEAEESAQGTSRLSLMKGPVSEHSSMVRHLCIQVVLHEVRGSQNRKESKILQGTKSER